MNLQLKQIQVQDQELLCAFCKKEVEDLPICFLHVLFHTIFENIGTTLWVQIMHCLSQYWIIF